MARRIEFIAAGAIALAFAADLILNGGSVSLFLALKLLDLVALISFWR